MAMSLKAAASPCGFNTGQAGGVPVRHPNQQPAAIQALDVFRFLKANGWPATLAKYKPEVGTVKFNTTIGEYLAAVRNTNRFRRTS